MCRKPEDKHVCMETSPYRTEAHKREMRETLPHRLRGGGDLNNSLRKSALLTASPVKREHLYREMVNLRPAKNNINLNFA